MLTPCIFIQLLRAIPGSGAGSAAVCRRLLSLKRSLGFTTVRFQVVLLGPSLHVVEFREPRRLVAGGDDDVSVVGIFAQGVSRHGGDEVSSSDNVRSRSDT